MKQKNWQYLTWATHAVFLLVFAASCNSYPSPVRPAAPDQSTVLTLDPGLHAETVRPASTSTLSGLAVRNPTQPSTPTQPTETALVPAAPSHLNPKVFVLIFNPILDNGMTMVEAKGFYDPEQLTQEYIDFIYSASSGRVQYSISKVFTLDDIPVKADGFQYSHSSYIAVLSGEELPHMPDGADYISMLAKPEYSLCNRLNRGEIDEVWLFAGPWMGFYESRLAGPGAFYMNGLPLELPGCERLLPIMGFNYERSLDSMVEDFGHRAEAVMTYVYGSWEQNRMLHAWDLFGLSAVQSPSYDYTGCGSIHYPPNALYDYHYNNRDGVQSVCDDFLDYPHLGHPVQVRQPLDCTAWDCAQLGYFHWWLSHFPQVASTSATEQLSDWWKLIIDPNLIPANITRAATPTPKAGTFSDLSAALPYAGPANFLFVYDGEVTGFSIEISTLDDMSFDVYLNFSSGSGSPLVTQNPADLWGKYICGKTLYWRVVTSDNVRSPIQSATVTCP